MLRVTSKWKIAAEINKRHGLTRIPIQEVFVAARVFVLRLIRWLINLTSLRRVVHRRLQDACITTHNRFAYLRTWSLSKKIKARSDEFHPAGKNGETFKPF